MKRGFIACNAWNFTVTTILDSYPLRDREKERSNAIQEQWCSGIIG